MGGARMRLLFELCDKGPCPAVWEADDGSIEVVGGLVAKVSPLVAVGVGEGVVRIPRRVLLEAARRLEGNS
jgi:hypothetical protein